MCPGLSSKQNASLIMERLSNPKSKTECHSETHCIKHLLTGNIAGTEDNIQHNVTGHKQLLQTNDSILEKTALDVHTKEIDLVNRDPNHINDEVVKVRTVLSQRADYTVTIICILK